MAEPRFRTAVADDIAELRWLEDVARTHLVDRRGGPFWLERHRAESPSWPSVAAGNVLVSTVDGVVLGYLRFDVSNSVLRIDDVFVHPEAREIGCGDGLLEAAIEVGRRRGAERVVAEALPGDRETKNLYERAAITAILITVSAPIVSGQSGQVISGNASGVTSDT